MQMLEFSAQHGIEAIERVRRRDVRMGLVLESQDSGSGRHLYPLPEAASG